MGQSNKKVDSEQKVKTEKKESKAPTDKSGETKSKSVSPKDGQALMLDVWGADNGVLKITPCLSETDKNTQNGIKFLSAGLMQAIRNPTAHEPAIDWPINKQDCLDLLGFVSYLFRQLDSSVYVKEYS